MVQSNNLLKKIVFLIGFIVISEIYGKEIINSIFDTFQKNICTDSFCITKPKGWLPLLVKKKNTVYKLNIIPTTWIPWKTKEGLYLKNFKEGVELFNGEKIITVVPYTVNELKLKNLKKHIILSQRCYERQLKLLNIVYCFDMNIAIIQDKFDKKIIKEILSNEILKNNSNNLGENK